MSAKQLRTKWPTLNKRQLEIIAMVASSKTRKEIASNLGLSVHGVDWYLWNIHALIGDHDPAFLTRFAIKEHLISL